MYTTLQHLLIFGPVMVAAWCLFIYFWPRMLLSVYKRGLLVKGFGDGPIPVNTPYTEPQKLFAEPFTSQTASSSNLMTVGVNHDTLATVGWLDLSKACTRQVGFAAIYAYSPGFRSILPSSVISFGPLAGIANRQATQGFTPALLPMCCPSCR
jgi:hypothetical protein